MTERETELRCVKLMRATYHDQSKMRSKKSGIASRYREHTTEKDGVLSYIVEMDFRSRRDIANAFRTQDGGRMSKYYLEFEKAAYNYMQVKFAEGRTKCEDEIRLIEPQKFLPFQSRKTRAFLWGIATAILGFFNKEKVRVCKGEGGIV